MLFRDKAGAATECIVTQYPSDSAAIVFFCTINLHAFSNICLGQALCHLSLSLRKPFCMVKSVLDFRCSMTRTQLVCSGFLHANQLWIPTCKSTLQTVYATKLDRGLSFCHSPSSNAAIISSKLRKTVVFCFQHLRIRLQS